MPRVHPSLFLVPPEPGPTWLFAPADNNAGKGVASAPAVGFFMVKYDSKAGARARAHASSGDADVSWINSRVLVCQKRVAILYSFRSTASLRWIAFLCEKYLYVDYIYINITFK